MWFVLLIALVSLMLALSMWGCRRSIADLRQEAHNHRDPRFLFL